MNAKLKRFIFLSMALHLMDIEIDMDEHGLTIEMMEKMDELLADYLDPEMADSMSQELIELTKELTAE